MSPPGPNPPTLKVRPRSVVGFIHPPPVPKHGLALLIVAWSGTMKMLEMAPNCCVAGAMTLSPVRMVLASSRVISELGGARASTRYLPVQFNLLAWGVDDDGI